MPKQQRKPQMVLWKRENRNGKEWINKKNVISPFFHSSAVCALEFFSIRAILHHLRRNNVRKLTSSETKANGGEKENWKLFELHNCAMIRSVRALRDCKRVVLCVMWGENFGWAVAVWLRQSSLFGRNRRLPLLQLALSLAALTWVVNWWSLASFFFLLLLCSQFYNVAFLLRTPFPSLAALTHFPPHWSKSRAGIKIFEPVCRHSLCNGKRRRISDAFFKYHSSLSGWN